MRQLIEVRKLAAIDMAWLGPRLVVAEYALGVLLPLALGVWSVAVGRARQPHAVGGAVVVGLWLVGIAMNYVPLLVYAVGLARSGAWQVEGRPEIARAGRYGVQQVMLLVPLFVAVLAVVQARSRRQAS